MCGIESKIVRGTAGGGPHAWNLVKINEEYLHIASPERNDGDLEWIWEIRAKQQDLFPEAHQ